MKPFFQKFRFKDQWCEFGLVARMEASTGARDKWLLLQIMLGKTHYVIAAGIRESKNGYESLKAFSPIANKDLPFFNYK